MITDELENELRGVFARAGADITVPPQVRQRLLQREYHPARFARWLRAGMAAAAVTLAATAAITVTALLPAGHPASPPQPGAQLAAWTVVRHGDGTVTVTIRQLRDPAGLQRRLRADGIPASVTFCGQLPRSCQRYAGLSQALVNRVFSGRQQGRFPVMVIHPAALPHGAGVAINPPDQPPVVRVAIGLVHASPRCTGG
jgi:hypothetical protein